MWLRLSGLTIALGVTMIAGTLPAQGQVTDSQVNALVEALRLNAPPASPSGERLYSEWQVKGENIPRWSQTCIGRSITPESFEASPVTARWILVCILRDTLRAEYKASGNNEAIAVRRAASWWMTGNPANYATGDTGAYTQRVLTAYQQKQPIAAKPATNPAAANPIPPAPTSGSAPTPSTPTETKPGDSTPAKPATTPDTSQNRTTIYDRYMQAGYEAAKKRDSATALLNFRRALDERPGDTYATQAIQNIENFSRGQSSATPTSPLPRSTASTPPQPDTPAATSTPAFPAPSSSPNVTTVSKPTPLPKPKPATATASKPATPSPALPTVVVPSVAPVSVTLTQQEAVDLVNRWLQAKADIFAPPFDQQQALNLTTGELLSSLMKPDGVLAWLKNNRAYYRYGVQKVDSVDRFLAARDRATLEVTLTEDRTLYFDGVIDPKRTDFSAQRVRFSLEASDGTWKIADYKTVDGFLLERSVGRD
ncbi:ARC6/PARC6 family protein [Leptodesmis sichuanensis]|uniref:ARC6/PARC6 family protein n=1 Tax=Leptodesmis sichuanensis TaxID=2906798 RepID=UPI001F1F745A|nr:ARC6/PARC6 family protein [Leptodesmis sichuanensis]UIE39282.1 DUF4101 domain-containing protein [Leptodesmis sichuanensis A121]